MPVVGVGLPPGLGPSPNAPPFDFTARKLAGASAPVPVAPAAFRAGDRIKDAASSVTSSLVTLAKNNPAGFNNFRDGVGDGNSCFYCLIDTAGNWEVTYGQYTDAAGTLTRAAVPMSSNTSPGVQATFSGTVTVFGNWPAGAELATGFGVPTGYFVGPWLRTQQNTTLRSNYVFYCPVMIPSPFSSFQMMFQGGGAPNSLDVGLYNAVGGVPFQLIGRQTGIAPTGGVQKSSVITCAPSPQGLYWAAMCLRNNGTGEGTNSFATIQQSQIGDPFGTDATNANYTGAYEVGTVLPVLAAQPVSRGEFGSLPAIPALWVRPIL